MTLDEMVGRLRVAPQKDEGRKRQAQVWKNEPVDRLPLVFGVATPGLQNAPHYNFEQCYNDKEKMLFESLHGMISIAESPGDGLPSMRCNSGTATLATTFGLNQLVFPDKMPWLKEHLTKEQISALTPDDFADVACLGVMPMVLEYQRFFKENLNGAGKIFLSDTQGPFGIAHLVRGDDIFIDMYDDPPFAHHLLELTTTVYINATRLMKENIGEPYTEAFHSNGLCMPNGGVRVCEDSSVLLSPKLIEEFVAPYTARVLEAFGGGFIHYCGRNDHLLKALVQIPYARGFNFGMTERYDLFALMNDLLEHDKVYYGDWVRLPGETLMDYFKRILSALGGEKRGLILTPVLQGDARDPKRIMEEWAAAQG